jgi:hypothetical protein
MYLVLIYNLLKQFKIQKLLFIYLFLYSFVGYATALYQMRSVQWNNLVTYTASSGVTEENHSIPS